MQLETNIEMRDFEAFLEHYRATRSSQVVNLNWALILLIIGGVAAVSYSRAGVAGGFPFWCSAFVAWALLGKRWFRWFSGRLVKAALAKQDLSAHLGTQRLRVTPEGLIFESEKSKSTMTWNSVKRIETTSKHTFVYLSDVSALIIPHRAAAPEQLGAFLAALRREAAA